MCGWVPQVLLYSDRDSFSYEACQNLNNYVELYSREDTSIYAFLKDIFHFSLVKPRANPFEESAPEVIVFMEGQPDREAMEKLSGMIYVADPQVAGNRLLRLDRELSAMMNALSASDPKPLDHEEKQNLRARLQAALDSKDWSGARQALLELLAAEPDNIELILLLAEVLFNDQKGLQAVELLNRVLGLGRLSPQASLALFQKVIYTETRMGQVEQAKQRLRIMLQRHPGNPQFEQMLRALDG